MNKVLLNYIILGSKQRLQKFSFFKTDPDECLLPLNFNNQDEIIGKLDTMVANANGNIIVLLPPGCQPNQSSRKTLKKMALINQPSWGWFAFSSRRKNLLQHLKKANTFLRYIPSLEQGIFFSKDLYFSLGGMGAINLMPFEEIAKRLYSRIDPQKTLPALIIRSKDVKIT